MEQTLQKLIPRSFTLFKKEKDYHYLVIHGPHLLKKTNDTLV